MEAQFLYIILTQPITTSTGIDVTGQVDVNSVARIDSSGIVKSASGTEASPSHSFLNDPDNGMFRVTTNTIGFSTAGSEAMRIDSSGNLLVGTVDTNVANNSGSGNDGVNIHPDSIRIARTDGDMLLLNRLNSDGDIAKFLKDGTAVGSIGTVSNTVGIHGAGSGDDAVGLLFVESGSGQRIVPCQQNFTPNNGIVNLGWSTNRFKDAYLSGGVYLGGTAAANKLDDAEYGVWNPGNYNIALASSNGNYVKVGRMCTVAFRLVWPSNSNTAQAKISLPFACVSHGSNAHMAGLAIAFTTYTNNPSGGVFSGGTFMEFYKTGQNQLTNADLSAKQINGSVTYITNA